MNATARPVYAVRLDAATGAVCEGFDRLEGTASTRDEAIAVARANGREVVTDGGLVETTPGEVVGEESDVWTVTVADPSARLVPLPSYDDADDHTCGCSGARVSIVSTGTDASAPAWRVCTFGPSEVRVHGLDATGADACVDTDAAGADALTV